MLCPIYMFLLRELDTFPSIQVVNKEWCSVYKAVDYKLLMTGPRETVNLIPQYPPRETSRFEGNKINCFPADKSLSDLLYSRKSSL